MFNKPRRYSRSLSAMERYSLVIHNAYHYHVDGVVEGVGDIDPAQLRAAVATAAAANPGIRVRLKGLLGFSRWVDSGVAPEVNVVNDSAWDGASQLHAPFMARRLEARGGGPIADVFLVRGRDQRTRLVFRALHGAIDGRGMMYWIAEVFRVLRGEALLGSSSTLTDMDVQAKFRDAVRAGRQPDIDTSTPAEDKPAAPPPPASPLCLPVVEAGAGVPLAYVWRRIVINRNVSNQLTKTAMFLARWARRRGPGEVGFTIPVDYRGLRTDEMSIGNLTGYLRLKVAESDTSRSLMLQLNNGIRSHADCRQFPGIRIILWLPIWYMTKKLREKLDTVLYTINKDSPSGGIVSMGSWKNEWFSCPGFESKVSYGIPGSVGKLNVLFTHYPGFTVATFAAPAAYNHRGQLDEMIQAYQAHFSA